MTTPTRYPTKEEVIEHACEEAGVILRDVTERGIIKAAIDIERERVEKEAGEVSAYQYRYKTWSGSWSEWVSCDESTVRALQSSKHREDHETRALVVQNSASNPLSPGEYFRCDECHEPAGTRQVCRRCVRLEIERDDAGEVSCWRVAGGTWVDGEPLPCDYKDAEQNGWAIELAYIAPVFAGKTGTETRALVVQTSAVKVPDGLIESLSRNWQISDDVSVCGVHREAVDMAITIIQSLTHPTETPR